MSALLEGTIDGTGRGLSKAAGSDISAGNSVGLLIRSNFGCEGRPTARPAIPRARRPVALDANCDDVLEKDSELTSDPLVGDLDEPISGSAWIVAGELASDRVSKWTRDRWALAVYGVTIFNPDEVVSPRLNKDESPRRCPDSVGVVRSIRHVSYNDTDCC